jgi:ribosome biogenesis GTPase
MPGGEVRPYRSDDKGEAMATDAVERDSQIVLEPHAAALGTVRRKSVGQYWVQVGGQTVVCSISNKLRKQLVYPIAAPSSIRRHVVAVKEIRQVDPIAIGDVVRFTDAGDGSGMITEVLPRRNCLVRRAAGPKPLEQVIVANVDQVVTVVAAAHPAPSWELLDRHLAAAEAMGLPALICITKLDVAETDSLAAEVETFERIGYPVILTSAVTGEGMSLLEAALKARLSVLVGKSGVGKTSLLNALQPGLGLRVSEVSRQTDKGRHTTSYLELFALDVGGSIVDTPGMREFGLWEVPGAEVAEMFREMRPYLGRCRFGADCSHRQEPGCVLRQAAESGAIAERRYRSYLRMRG